MTEIIKSIDLAAKEILDGNVIGLPTETVYGLGANVLNEKAVLKIFETKERPLFNPLIVHFYDREKIYDYVKEIPDKAIKLMEKFSPGPISFVLRKKKIIPDLVTSGLDTAAVRFPSHKMFRELLKEVQVPICAPSANMFGKISPTSAEDAAKDLNGKVKYILDGGRCEYGIESTVVSFNDDGVQILRPGFITKEEIEKIIGKISSGESEKIISPGLLKTHYSPATPLYLSEKIFEIGNYTDKKFGVLDFSKYKEQKEIALNLFSDLRKLDEMKFDFIVAKKIKNTGLGFAINDRLEKASKGFIKIENDSLKFIEK